MLNPDQRELARQYMPLAEAMAWRCARWLPNHRDDLRSAAYCGLVTAAAAFDPEHGVYFPTYARLVIRGELSDYRRKWVVRDRLRQVVDLVVCEIQGGTVIGIGTPPDHLADVENRDAVDGCIKRLPGRHATVARLLYRTGLSQGQAARRMHLSPTRVSRLNSALVVQLRDNPP